MSTLKLDTVLQNGPISIVGCDAIHRRTTVDAVLNARRRSENGRSQWLKFVTDTGDVIFGCFPQGDTCDAVNADEAF